VPVPPGFDDWFAKACNRDPDARFQTARDLAESLRDALDLGSEAGAAIPESKWVSSKALLHARTIASQAPTLSSETTVPDPSSRRTNEDTRPTRVDPPPPENESEEAAPNSRWEIVPHGENESAPRHDFVPLSESTADIERAAGLPLGREESGGGGSVAFVAIIALMIGGAVVFGIRHIRENHAKDDAQAVESRNVGEGNLRPRLKTGSAAQKKGDKERPLAPAPSAPPGDKSSPETSPSETPANETGAPEEGTTTSEGGEEETAEKTLDAFDLAAQEALKARQKALAEKDKAAQEKGVTSKDATDEKGSPGPEPKLPDGLAPAPAPPPPAP
jgi:hypothetical protein